MKYNQVYDALLFNWTLMEHCLITNELILYVYNLPQDPLYGDKAILHTKTAMSNMDGLPPVRW